MTLNRKVAAVVAALFVLFGLASFLVARAIILPSFLELEEQAARTDMQRVVATFERELDRLLLSCADWGNWADTYRFAETHDRAFIEENMTPSSLEGAEVDIVAILDRDARFLWTAGFDPADRVERRYALLSGQALEPSHPFSSAIAEGRQAQGVVWTEHGPAFLVASPILDGDGGGPHRGSVLFGRMLTAQVIGIISQQAQVPLTTQALPAGAMPTSATSIARHDEVLDARHTIADVHGRPVLTLNSTLPRHISRRGEDAVQFAHGSLVLAALVVLAAVFLALRAIVVRPIARIQAFAAGIAETDDLSQRLPVSRGDEVGQLAAQINSMVERLARARREVVDKSFEAGLAEMARGVLHNIGNALTPVLVHAGALQASVGRLPSVEFERVGVELARGDLDAGRRADLLEFLRLAGAELRSRTAEIADASRAIGDSTMAIQTILHQQSRFARTALVVETVAIDDLVRHGLRLVPPAKLAALDVVVDDSVAQAGALSMPRVALEQVVQNLVVNAGEATVPGRRVRLHIAAAIEQDGHARRLHLSFADDGVGVPAGDLARIFQKGFSTKPPDTNSGIGLHWSANVVNGFGGSLRAASAGPGRGTTLHLCLPLGLPAAAPAHAGIAA
jgi:sensor domain CHASE-containing protein